MREQVVTSLLVGAGGALGTLFRHGLNISTLATPYPVGTVIENLLGCLLLGILVGWATQTTLATRWVQYGVGVGFCGGFTTMSTFASDTLLVHLYYSPAQALMYVGLSLAGGLVLVTIGDRLGVGLARRKLA